MSFATAADIATMFFCAAVLVQTLRLMRLLKLMRDSGFGDMVGALERATAEARQVLGRLTELMRGDVAVTTQTLADGQRMIEELTVMTGIANAVADRIVDASDRQVTGAAE